MIFSNRCKKLRITAKKNNTLSGRFGVSVHQIMAESRSTNDFSSRGSFAIHIKNYLKYIVCSKNKLRIECSNRSSNSIG